MSVWLTDLAEVCRSSGLRVIEEPGWRTRGHGGLADRPRGIICHHTAASARAYRTNPYPSLRTVRDGRSDLPGPLSQLGLQRDLAVRVIAAGRCWHAGRTAYSWQDNDHSIGIEAEHDGVSPWPADLYDAYVQLVAALRRGYRLDVPRVAGHKEAAVPRGRKTDPNFDMDTFRMRVTTYRPDNNEEDDMADPQVLAALGRIEAGQKGIITALTTLSQAEAGRYADVANRVQVGNDEERARYVDYRSRFEGAAAELQEISAKLDPAQQGPSAAELHTEPTQ